MSQGYSPLEGTQEDINRRLLRKINALEKSTDNDTVYDDTALKARVKALEDALGEYEDENTIAERLTALETPASEQGS